MVTVRIPTPLRPYVGGNEHVTAAGRTVREALDDLTRQFPDLKPHLFDDDKLRGVIHVFVDEEPVRYLDDLETPITKGDRLRIMIIPPIVGG